MQNACPGDSFCAQLNTRRRFVEGFGQRRSIIDNAPLLKKNVRSTIIRNNVTKLPQCVVELDSSSFG